MTEAYDFSTPVLSNITLYAKWTAESGTYTVTFNSNGGSSVASQTVNAGEKAVKPSNPSKSGCIFAGWYSDAALTTQYNFNSAVAADLTLYAKWTASGGGGYVPSSEYKVTFDAGSGANIIGADPDSQTIVISVGSGKSIENIPMPTKSGYAFLGWNMQFDGDGGAFTDSTKVRSTYTVYAQWSSEKIISQDGLTINLNSVGNTADDLVEKAVKSKSTSIIFDLSANNSVQISKIDLSALNAAMVNEDNNVIINSLTFVTSGGSATIEQNLLSRIVDSLSDGNNLSISIEDVTSSLTTINAVKLTVDDAPVFQISIKGGSNELNLPDGSKINVTVAHDNESIDLENYNIFYVSDDGIILESYEIIDYDEKTITFAIVHNSYYALLSTDMNDRVMYAVNSVNAWMKSAELDSLFDFTIDKDQNNITLTIDADKVFGDNNALEDMNAEAFNGLLTNFGMFVNALFGDTTVSVKVNNPNVAPTLNTILNSNGISNNGLKNFILDFGYGFFEIISKMNNADGDGTYPFKTMDVIFGDSGTFNVAINFTGTKMDSIKSFAGTIADHIKMINDNGNIIIELKAPDALMNSVYDKIKNMDPSNTNDNTAKLLAWAIFNCNMKVEGILSNIGELDIDEVFGSESNAIGRLVSIMQSNPGIINKVLGEITSISYICPDELDNTLSSFINATSNTEFVDTCEGECEGHSLIGNSNQFNMSNNDWSAFILAISDLLSKNALDVNPGNFYIGDGKYQIGIEMELSLEELSLNSVPINFTIILDIFDDDIDELVSMVLAQYLSPN